MQQRYASDKSILNKLASNLLKRQDQSVYAARALPRLLRELNDEERLMALAFDERIPASIAGTVGKRNISVTSCTTQYLRGHKVNILRSDSGLPGTRPLIRGSHGS